ncbi:SGNH/GDSL hydrolase family protein [Pseudorhodoplanes sinuspersici]|uniref:Uncharacterized protein n=1 Tax=Pseudorhodoplanes sinuspersici TaxID=1235591 RepID=A0A1W6ZMR6_9HYPH|nr:SGNH/GDSL hydrolase family protein [Pseudorhodoplanes sinuspersici]ARP98649.1 hypothetical protein CAK95_05805 [Pseudorhodoplanes sinuspersici]RKE69762.1 lysophospholipase L1-like esterase [Pseudorhodoplanes sinuspersici]
MTMSLLRPFCLPTLAMAAACAATIASVAQAEDKTPAPVAPVTQAAPAPVCSAPDDMTRLMNPLARTGKRIAAGEPVKIVAFGSSSTAGAFASSPDKSYPNRLAVELKERFPGQPITVVNRGANGEEAPDMLLRLDAEVLSEKPDLILWQVGTNAVLRDAPMGATNAQILEGLKRMKTSGADVVLIDPQFAPMVVAKKETDAMVHLLAITAKTQNVDLFQRFAVMRHWRNVARLPFEAFISPDDLHMNDWSYACVAKLLGGAIAEAATRTSLTASAGRR